MSVSLVQLGEWTAGKENEHLEFKEAKNNFHFEKLVKYCVALANEGGGKMILGVTDRLPRRVVGTNTFIELERTKAGILDRLHFIRVDADEVAHPDGRVLVFHVPSRPLGTPVQYEGAYWMRSGEELVPMTADQLQRIFAELEPDYSAAICKDASLTELEPAAIENFRQKWITESKRANLASLSHEQLLSDAGLLRDRRVTYAALVLFGTEQALARHLPQAEVIFEYRSREASIPYQQRSEFRKGLFLFYDELWETVNLRNEVQQVRNGLFARDVPTFNEDVIREAILNGICHRDYRLQGSIFVRQYPRSLEIVSPGGFPPGVTVENILSKQVPRNRCIAEAIAKCDMVERGGQGVNLMFEECIKESKPTPDYSGTDDFEVRLRLNGTIQNPAFVRYLEQLGTERVETFSTEDFLVLAAIYRDQPIHENLRGRLPHLRELGAIEHAGRGAYRLSRGFYRYAGQKGTYTRKSGLDRETNKALLLKHIKDNDAEGAPLSDLMQVLPNLSRRQIQRLLQELREDEKAHSRGRTAGARWHPGPAKKPVAPTV